MTKPFGMDELLARLRAATRRATPGDDEPVVTTEHFIIDLAAKQVTLTGWARKWADADRMAAPRDPHPPPGPAGHRPTTAAGRGTNLSNRDALSCVHGSAATQVGTRSSPARYLLTEAGMGYRMHRNSARWEP